VQANVEAWLQDRPGGTALEDFKGSAPTLQKGEDILTGIERLHRRVRELAADLNRIGSAPFPSVYATTQLRDDGRTRIDVLAAQGLITKLDALITEEADDKAR
jgi:hypothetical protein